MILVFATGNLSSTCTTTFKSEKSESIIWDDLAYTIVDFSNRALRPVSVWSIKSVYM